MGLKYLGSKYSEHKPQNSEPNNPEPLNVTGFYLGISVIHSSSNPILIMSLRDLLQPHR